MRIVSLVPSKTELLHYLGLDTEVVGITKFCIHPPGWRKTKMLVGGTKDFSVEKIIALKPDIVIANKEENEQSRIEALMQKVPVYMSDIVDFDSAVEMIVQVGIHTHTETKTKTLIADIQSAWQVIPIANTEENVLYLIWRKPYMAAGKGTFIDSILHKLGWQNASSTARYPELSITDIQTINPSMVLLSSEPYPFGDKHIAELQTILPNAKIILVDGEMFSWYGSRMLYAPSYFHTLITELS